MRRRSAWCGATPNADFKLSASSKGAVSIEMEKVLDSMPNAENAPKAEKVLEINGLGYRANVAGQKLNLELGFSHPVNLDIPAGLTVVVDPKSGAVTIKGSDKFKVGDFAAKIRRIRPPEPYKGSGIKYQGEHIVRKAGKTAAGGK